MQLPLSTYSLSYRPDLDIVFLRWLAPDTLAEAQASYEAALALALAHGCGKWLLDSRRSGPLDLFETAWLTRTFFPAAVAQLAPRALRLAVFSSVQRWEQMRTDTTVAPAVQAAIAATQPYEAAIFLTEAEAVEWLLAPAPWGQGGVAGPALAPRPSRAIPSDFEGRTLEIEGRTLEIEGRTLDFDPRWPEIELIWPEIGGATLEIELVWPDFDPKKPDSGGRTVEIGPFQVQSGGLVLGGVWLAAGIGVAGEAGAQVVVGGLGTGLLVFSQELDVAIHGEGVAVGLGAGRHHRRVGVEGQLFELLAQGGEGGHAGGVLPELGQIDEAGHEGVVVGGVLGGFGHEGHRFIGHAEHGFAFIRREGKEVGGQGRLNGIEVGLHGGEHRGGNVGMELVGRFVETVVVKKRCHLAAGR